MSGLLRKHTALRSLVVWEGSVMFFCLVCSVESRSEALPAPAPLLRGGAGASSAGSTARAGGSGCRVRQAHGVGGGNEVGKGVVGRSRAEVLQEPLVADAVLVGPAPSWLATACVWGRGPGGGCFRLVLVDLPHLAVLCRQVRKTAVLRFLALPPAAQLVLLDRLAHPVYKYTRPLKAAANTCPVLLTPLSQSLRFAGAWTLASR